jgi:hypothetical protein
MSLDSQRAKSALLALDAGCARDEWVKILASAKSAGIDFETVDEWCSTAANYRDTNDVQSVWRGLRDTGGITENTLFFLARQSGWEDGKQANYRQPVAPRKKPATLHQPENQAMTRKPSGIAASLPMPHTLI